MGGLGSVRESPIVFTKIKEEPFKVLNVSLLHHLKGLEETALLYQQFSV